MPVAARLPALPPSSPHCPDAVRPVRRRLNSIPLESGPACAFLSRWEPGAPTLQHPENPRERRGLTGPLRLCMNPSHAARPPPVTRVAVSTCLARWTTQARPCHMRAAGRPGCMASFSQQALHPGLRGRSPRGGVLLLAVPGEQTWRPHTHGASSVACTTTSSCGEEQPGHSPAPVATQTEGQVPAQGDTGQGWTWPVAVACWVAGETAAQGQQVLALRAGGTPGSPPQPRWPRGAGACDS